MPRPPLLQTGLKLALLLYPFYVWWAITAWHPAAAIVPVALLALGNALLGTKNSRSARVFFGVSCILLLLALLSGQAEQAMLYYPVWMNAGMLLLFSWSLWFPPTVIARIARLMDGELDAKALRYTRNVTRVWCGFFLINGSLAAATAWWGDWDLWLLYNGIIAYILMAALMLIEWRVRQVVKAAH